MFHCNIWYYFYENNSHFFVCLDTCIHVCCTKEKEKKKDFFILKCEKVCYNVIQCTGSYRGRVLFIPASYRQVF